ncbi:MAG: hypothetical protein ACI4M9_00945, partial [Succinivibrio sp.]
MKTLLIFINNQWIRLDPQNISVIATQSTDVNKNDSINTDELKLTLRENKNIINDLSSLAFTPTFGLDEIIVNPSDIKKAFCSYQFKIKKDCTNKYEYTVSAAIVCNIKKNDLKINSKAYAEILTVLRDIEQRDGFTYCSLMMFLKDNDLIEFLQQKYYGYGYPKLDELFDFSITAANEKFRMGHNIFFDNMIECAENIAFHDEKQPERFSFATDIEMQYFTSSMMVKYGFDLENAPDDDIEQFKSCMLALDGLGDVYPLYYIGKTSILNGNRVFEKDLARGEEYLLLLIENCDDEAFAHSGEVCTLLGDLYSSDCYLHKADFDLAYKYYSMAEKYGSKIAMSSIFSLLLNDRIEHVPASLADNYSKLLKQELTDSVFYLYKAVADYTPSILSALGDECVKNAD